MDDNVTYQIEVKGQVDEGDLNAMSPLQLKMVVADPGKQPAYDSTNFSIQTDQSGLIGLLRHLHGRGIIFLSVKCER